MRVKIHSIHFDADQKLLDFIQERVDKLTHFYNDIIGGEVFLRVEKAKDTANKVVHVKLDIPGNNLFVKEQRQTFEEAMDICSDALYQQIKKHKEKLRGV